MIATKGDAQAGEHGQHELTERETTGKGNRIQWKSALIKNQNSKLGTQFKTQSEDTDMKQHPPIETKRINLKKKEVQNLKR